MPKDQENNRIPILISQLEWLVNNSQEHAKLITEVRTVLSTLPCETRGKKIDALRKWQWFVSGGFFVVGFIIGIFVKIL